MEAFLAANGCGGGVSLILWIVAAILVIWGIVIGLLIGPGGVSIFC
jgi:hypothetical protein